MKYLLSRTAQLLGSNLNCRYGLAHSRGDDSVFWVLIGQYAYREAKKENRSSPKLRGIFWGVFGIAGAATYLAHIQEQEKNRLAWLGFSILLFVGRV